MNEVRVDRSLLPRVTRTTDGYLRGDAVVTRAGVFKYMNADGSVRHELRHPDDVFSRKSMDSLKMIPITVDHPTELVNATNASKLSVGSTGENVREEGNHLVAPLTITHDSGIKAISSGKQELSLGYRLDLIEERGVYEGVEYTHRQTNIDYNHLAIVDVARAGRAARLNLDGASVQIVEADLETEIPMNKINIDGIQYDAAPEVDRHVQKLTNQVAQLTSDAATAVARADRAEGERDVAKREVTDLKTKLDSASDQKVVGERVRARIELVGRASQIKGVRSDDLMKLDSDRSIMESAMKVRHPTLAFDGKSDDYVSASFDAELRNITPVAQAPLTRDPLAAPVRGDGGQIRDDAAAAEAAWKKSNEDMNAWRYQK